MTYQHEGHPGNVKLNLRAQTSVYWIGSQQGDRGPHEPCQVNGKSQSKEPVIPTEIPNTSWQKLGAHYYSKFCEVHGLPATSSKDVISALSSSFQCSVFQRRSSLTMVVSSQPRITRILQPGMVSESQQEVLTTPEDMD